MTNEELKNMPSIIDTLLDEAITDSTRQKVKDKLTEVCKLAIKALETTCIEDYPTCTECEHYDREKHYCPRFCQVIKDTLAEAQPCEDYISRKSVDKIINKWLSHPDYELKDNIYDMTKKIHKLPSVTPSYNSINTELKPCEDCISRAKALNTLRTSFLGMSFERYKKAKRMFEQLPSVTPQRTKGKWIKIQSGDKDFPESIVCSRCKNENSHLDFDEHGEPIGKVFVTSKYCPNCGSYNGGGEDEEKSL